MMELFTIEFWIAVLFIVDLVIVGLLLVFVKKLKPGEASSSHKESRDALDKVRKNAFKSSEEIISMLEPLVRESTVAAKAFEKNLQEKKIVAKRLNHALDDKIISLNLLLSRAETLINVQQSGGLPAGTPAVSNELKSLPNKEDVFDQQNRILDCYHQGLDAGDIASRLSIPKGEVDLVIGLKKKFAKMDRIG